MELLRRPGVRQQSPAYVGRLLRACGAEANGQAEERAALDDSDELTPREREILAYVARGASNQAIADELVLSVGTVKGHVNHIFSKLGVHSRTAAVARARERDLIEL
jgi:LuxR family maltose regulon positive regulatory protein